MSLGWSKRRLLAPSPILLAPSPIRKRATKASNQQRGFELNAMAGEHIAKTRLRANDANRSDLCRSLSPVSHLLRTQPVNLSQGVDNVGVVPAIGPPADVLDSFDRCHDRPSVNTL